MNNNDSFSNKYKNIPKDDFVDVSDATDIEIEIENLSFDLEGKADINESGELNLNSTNNVNSNVTNSIEESTENSGITDSDNSSLNNAENLAPWDNTNESTQVEESINDDLSSDNQEDIDNDSQDRDISEQEQTPVDENTSTDENASTDENTSTDENASTDDKSESKNSEEKSHENESNSKEDNKNKDTDNKNNSNDEFKKDNKETNNERNGKKDSDNKGDKPSDKNNNVDNSNNKSTNNQSNKNNTGQNNKPEVTNKKNNNNNNLKNNKGKKPKKIVKNPEDRAARTLSKMGNPASAGNTKTLNNAKKAGQKLGKAAKKVGQKAAKTAGKVAGKAGEALIRLLSNPYVLAAVIIILVFVLLVVIVIPAFGAQITPGQGSDVKEDFSSFSVNDQEILEQLNSEVYRPNAELALFTVAYPYFESLQEGGIDVYLNQESLTEEEQSEFQTWYSEKKNEILESFGCDELCQDLLGESGIEQIAKSYFKEYLKSKVLFWNNDCHDSDGNNISCDSSEDIILESISEDDPYLTIFKKRKMRKKYAELLKQLSSTATMGDYSSEENFFSYLKTDYFKEDAGYKALFEQVSEDKKEEFTNLIIDDIKANANTFSVYIKENCSTTYNFLTGSQITPSSEEMKSMMMGNVVIDLLDAGCGNTNTCTSYYSAPIPLEKYVKGVVYEELGSSDNLDQIKAQMVAAKSYTLSRHKPSVVDGVYVIKMRWSTADQDYCDYENGCMDVKEEYGYDNIGDCVNSDGSQKCKHWANREPASEEKKALYDQAWEETKNVYVIDSNGTPRGSYMEGCSKGTCMNQAELEKITNMDYQSILQSFYTDYAIAIQEGEYVSAMIGTSSTICGVTSGDSLGIPDDKFKFYYQTDYTENFCGSTSTIAKAGCGGTSYAMLVANLSDNTSFNPIDASNEATGTNTCGNWGSGDTLFTNTLINKHSRFKTETLSEDSNGVQDVLDVIRNGGLVAANVQANSPFTGGGHWILIRGITKDGKVKVADPASKDKSLNQTYDINEFISDNWLVDDAGYTHSWIAIYGPKSEEIKNNYGAGDGVATGTLVYPIEENKGSWSDGTVNSSNHLNYSNGTYHGGNDISVSKGTGVLAMDGGEVVMADTTTNIGSGQSEGYRSFGKFIVIKHTINGKNYYSVYAHLDSISVSVGQKVSQGQEIGKSGNTGNSSGPHLHIAFSYDSYNPNSGAPIYNDNIIAPYIYISGNKAGQTYINDVGKDY